MASRAPSERMFERLGHVVHEILPFSTVKISHSLSSIFLDSRYDGEDEQRVVAEFEANWEKSCSDASDTSMEIGCDKCRESVRVYLFFSRVGVRNNSLRSMQMVQFVSIPDRSNF